ncbi:MAG: hypothetical protein ACLQGT_05455 [Terracidiphilus sp.]
MIEEIYHERSSATSTLRGEAAEYLHLRKPVQGRRPIASRRTRDIRYAPKGAEDYSAIKATFAAVQELKSEIRSQHDQTRAVLNNQHEQVTGRVEASRRDILNAIKASPAECLKLFCEFGSLFLLFALALRLGLGIDLVNPAFSVFMLFALALYWGMAQLKQRNQKRDTKLS